MVSKGVLEGTDHWIYNVPITVILGGKRTIPESRLPRPEVITLRIQIGRHADGPEPNFVLIHDFQVGDRDQSLTTEEGN